MVVKDNCYIIFWNAIQQFRDWSSFIVRGDGGVKQRGGTENFGCVTVKFI